MKRLVYGVLSSLLILSATLPAGAQTPTTTIAQSRPSFEQMYREQQVLTDEIKTMMIEMHALIEQMKALTSLPEGQTPTMADLYKQQLMLGARVDALLGQTKAYPSTSTQGAAIVQDVHQQQVAMMAELKSMMAELKTLAEVYRGRANGFRR